MKGVSDIIVLTMILLIGSSLATLAYAYYTGVLGDLFKTAELEQNKSKETMGGKMTIMGVDFDKKTIVVRNTGVTNLTSFAGYKNGSPVKIIAPKYIMPEQIAVITFINGFNHTDKIRITSSLTALDTIIP